MATVYGTSRDELIYESSPNRSLRTTQGNDIVYAASGNDRVYARGGNDKVYGQNGNDIMHGERGNDTLIGGNGNDRMAGADWYDQHGKGEVDRLTGGSGSDSFYLGTSTRNHYIGNGNLDYALITDFQLGQDQILVKKANFDRYSLETTFTASGIGTRIVDVSAGDLIGIVEGVRPWSLFVRQGNSYTTIGGFPIELT